MSTTLDEASLKIVADAVFEKYSYDFRNYSASSASRRTWLTMRQNGFETVEPFVQQLMTDRELLNQLLKNLSINVTSMFRNPEVFRLLQEKVLPRLETYPHIRIWSAGTASGEEAWSLAIMLKEANLLHRSLIYATDFNAGVLRHAFKGVFPLEKMPDYTFNYNHAGGEKSLSDYYTTSQYLAHFDPELRENIVFSTHNLATDHVFNEFHLIVCRNVLIYFNDTLVDRCLHLFHESLAEWCFLCLGNRESLRFHKSGKYFEELERSHRIFRRL